MARTRSIPDIALLPSSQGKYIIDTYRGQFRIRKWPRKVGAAKSGKLAEIQRRFKEASNTIKYADPNQVAQAIRTSANTGIYPRDLLGHAIMVGMADFIDENGQLITIWRPFLERVMFQGCRINRNTNQTIAAATITAISFNNPIIQTVPIWNIAAPTRFVVPNGVTQIEMKGGIRGNSVITNTSQLTWRKNGGTFWGEVTCDNDSTPAMQVETGPLNVIAGDYFELLYFGATAQQIAGVERTFGAMYILTVP